MTHPHWIEAGSGRRVLVCLHGVSACAEVWRDLLPALAAPGRRVVAWDMPGYGASPSIEPLDFAALAAALECLLDAVGVARAVLLGHSLGGMIALEAAARLPQRFEALVLACTTPAFGAPAGAAQQAFLEQRLGPLDRGGDMASLAAGLIPAMAGPDAPESLLEAHRRLMAAIPAAGYRAAIRALVHFDRRALLPQLGCPVLCIAGAADRIASPLVMRRMAERIPAGRFEELPGAGHLAPFEQPDAFVRRLEAFLARLA